MKRKIIYLLVVFMVFTMEASAKKKWGPTGHRVVGSIAEKHLKASTKRKLKKLLNKKSLAFLSTFGDEIKSDKRYRKFYTWHYVNMPLDENYDASKANPKGNLVTGIEFCKKIIRDKNSTDEDKAFYLKMLIHLIGDLHQPMHVGLAEDRGGNDFNVKWHNSDTNLHAVWDYKMLDQFGMSYQELALNADVLTKNEIKKIQQGTTVDWVNEVHHLSREVYGSAKKGQNLRYNYSYKYFKVVRTQLQIAGVRLAKVLNDLF